LGLWIWWRIDRWPPLHADARVVACGDVVMSVLGHICCYRCLFLEILAGVSARARALLTLLRVRLPSEWID
jgi:hypothetical protein